MVSMANSKYEYVRSFEQSDSLLANTWIVVRIDGRGFSKLTSKYDFTKPNDQNGLNLMNAAAEAVMKELPDLVLAYGNSDEYSFVFHKDCALFERRASKLTSTVVSTFTSYYVFLWSQYFPEKPLTPPLPSFDGRAICYPSDLNLRDYMSWRQVDCHINNLYNTTFWTLVQNGKMDAREAEQKLSGTVSADKNEILFKEFGINYNNEPECFKKGSVIFRDFYPASPKKQSFVPSHPSSPAIAAPQPRRVTRSASQPVEPTMPISHDSDRVSYTLNIHPGSTFFSATSTPSPPSSPSVLPNSPLHPLRINPVSPSLRLNHTSLGNSIPVSTAKTFPRLPTAAIKASYDSLTAKGPVLAPLPLLAPKLKPSRKPPTSLSPPNVITRENCSPTSPGEFPIDFPIAGLGHRSRHETNPPSAYFSTTPTDAASPSQVEEERPRYRSPSQPHLPSYFASSSYLPGGPSVVPLSFPTIPVNHEPRKLNVWTQCSSNTMSKNTERFSSELKDNITALSNSFISWKAGQSLHKDKTRSGPPTTRDDATQRQEFINRRRSRGWSMFANPSKPASPKRTNSDPEARRGSGWSDEEAQRADPIEGPTTASTTDQRVKGNSMIFSASESSSLHQVDRNSEKEVLLTNVSALPFQHNIPSLPFPNTDAFPVLGLSIQRTPPEFRSSISSSFPAATCTTTAAAAPSPRAPAAPAASHSAPPTISPSATPFLPTTTVLPPTGTTTQPILPFAAISTTLNAETQIRPVPSTSAEQSHIHVDASPNMGRDSRSKGKSAQGLQVSLSRRQYREPNDGRPVQMNRTQKDKDRKKRRTAKVVVEHVDIIKDEFWEKRPWILTGRTG